MCWIPKPTVCHIYVKITWALNQGIKLIFGAPFVGCLVLPCRWHWIKYSYITFFSDVMFQLTN
jgi:hypothetical protein